MAWQDSITKLEALPVKREEFGYVQKASWHHPDRLHEEVVELDSPFASKIAAGTQKYTFLLVGDQNAGKSTFLHTFSHYLDPRYLHLLSALPLLSSSFVNTRFLWEGDQRSERDELPFIDTDLGRAVVVLTSEDFAFFVQEHGLDARLVTEAPAGTIYFAIEFVELGGDHIDQLMHPELIQHDAIREVVAKSAYMLKACSNVCVYLLMLFILLTHCLCLNPRPPMSSDFTLPKHLPTFNVRCSFEIHQSMIHLSNQ
eukprot:m.62075 g.62075  ORF g.62075 m.62075 type:complete len:256 (+) comp11893_c0_seq2:60-827(+)